jgi:hypothetical protein
MRARLVAPIAIVCAFVGPTAAQAGGLYPLTDAAGGSLLSPGKTVRYAVQPGTDATTVEARRERDGKVLWRRPLTGVYGTTFVTTRSARAGLSADGSLLVLASFSRSQPAKTTSFALVPTRPSEPVRTLRLQGDWAFDALSADARTLYLIQRIGDIEGLRYNVRGVDVGALKLIPGVIAAKGPGSATEQMAGIPVNRIVDSSARWVYTLYTTTDGGAFIHALDTDARRAVCLDLPWKHVASRIPQLRMALGLDLTLRLAGRSAPVATIDLRTLQVRADRQLPPAV